MVYSWQDAENLNLPLIFSIPSYIVGYIKGNLGSKRFNKLKRGLLRAIREDYKNGTLLCKNNCMDTLLADFGLFINSIVKL
jgi:hypothetical protein